MKLIIYDEDLQIVELIEGVQNPTITDHSAEWEGDALMGINLPFLLVEDSVTVGGLVSDELITFDRKSEFFKNPEIDITKENEELKARLTKAESENKMNAMAIMELAEMILGG